LQLARQLTAHRPAELLAGYRECLYESGWDYEVDGEVVTYGKAVGISDKFIGPDRIIQRARRWRELCWKN